MVRGVKKMKRGGVSENYGFVEDPNFFGVNMDLLI